MKFCKDCKHCEKDMIYRMRDLCKSPVYVNLITGNQLTLDCNEARRIDFDNCLFAAYGYETCGPDAQYFEAKNES